jgi:hypothetical protein
MDRVLMIRGVSNPNLQAPSSNALPTTNSQFCPAHLGRLLGSWVLGVPWSLPASARAAACHGTSSGEVAP